MIGNLMNQLQSTTPVGIATGIIVGLFLSIIGIWWRSRNRDQEEIGELVNEIYTQIDLESERENNYFEDEDNKDDEIDNTIVDRIVSNVNVIPVVGRIVTRYRSKPKYNDQEAKSTIEKAKTIEEKVEDGSLEMEDGEVETSTIRAVNSFADKSPDKSDDNVGKLKMALSQDDVNQETIEQRLQTVLDYARIAEVYENFDGNYSLGAEAVGTGYSNDHPLIKSFNGYLNQISNKNDKIKELNNEVDNLRKEKQELESKADKYEKLTLSVDNFLENTSSVLPLGHNYNNANRSGKLDIISKKIIDGQIQNTALDNSLGYLQKQQAVGRSPISKELLNALDEISNGSEKKDRLEDIFQRIDQRNSKLRKITQTDIEKVKRDVDRLKNRAKDQSGVAADAIVEELENGKINQIICENEKEEFVFAADKTLNHFDDLLDEVESRLEVDDSIDQLQSDINSKQEGLEYYMDNRPEYNHNIPRLMKSNLDNEVGEAIEIASSGGAENATGRLYIIDVVYDLLDQVYTKQEYNSVLEAGA